MLPVRNLVAMCLVTGVSLIEQGKHWFIQRLVLSAGAHQLCRRGKGV